MLGFVFDLRKTHTNCLKQNILSLLVAAVSENSCFYILIGYNREEGSKKARKDGIFVIQDSGKVEILQSEHLQYTTGECTSFWAAVAQM